MASWHDITRDSEYQSLSPQVKLEVKRGFFDRVIGKDAEFLGLSKEAQQATFEEFMQTPDDTGQGYVTSMLGAAGRGFGEMVPGAIEGAGALTGIEGLRKAGQGVREGLESISPVNPLYAESVPVKLANVGGQALSVLATAGAGGAAGKALGGVGAATKGMQAAPLASAFLQGAAGGAREAEQYGMTGPEAYLKTLSGGAIEAGTEMLPFGLASETALAKRMFTGAPRTTSFLGSVASEAGEEGIGQIGSNIATKALAPAGVETPGITEGALEASLYGGFGGGVMGGINALIPTAPKDQTPEQKQWQAEINATPVQEKPAVTPEESAKNAQEGGIPVVTPDGEVTWLPAMKAALQPQGIQPAVQPSDVEQRLEQTMLNPALEADTIAAEVGTQAAANLEAIGDYKSAAAWNEFSKTAGEILENETPQPPVQPSEEVEEAAEVAIPSNEPNLQEALPEVENGEQIMPEPRQLPVLPEQQAAQAQKEGAAGTGIQPPTIETPENAPSPEIIEESLRQEPQDRIKSREAESPSLGGELRGPAEGEVEEEVTTPPEVAAELLAAPSLVDNLPALIAVRDNNATPEQVQSLVDQGLVEQVEGQNIITEAGVAEMPEAERPKLPPAAREAEVAGMPVPVERDLTKPEQMTLDEATEKVWPGNKNTQNAPKSGEANLNGMPAIKKAGGWMFTHPTLGRMPVLSPSEVNRLDHQLIIREALTRKNPVAVEPVDWYDITLPSGYVKQGDLYVFQPQTTNAAVETQKATPPKLGRKQNEIRNQIKTFSDQPVTDDSVARFVRNIIALHGNPSNVPMVRFATDAPLQVGLESNGAITIGLGGRKAVEAVRQADSPQAGFQRLADAIEEELIHLADFLAMREKWESQGKPKNFILFTQRETRKLTEDLQQTAKTLTASDRESLRKVIGSALAAYDEIEAVADLPLDELIERSANTSAPILAHSELVRSLIQANRSGEITATGYQKILGVIKQWYEDALKWLKQAYKPAKEGTFGPVLADRIASIESVLKSIEEEISQTTAAVNETPAPLAEGAGAAVVQSEPAGGSIPTVEKESPKTAIESTGKSLESGYGAVIKESRDLLRALGTKSPKAQTAIEARLKSLKTAKELQDAFEVVTGEPTKLTNINQLRNNILNALLDEYKAQQPAALPPAEQTFDAAERQAEEDKRAESIARLFDKERKKPVKGIVSQSDVEQAIGIVGNNGTVPNAPFTWRGKASDLLAMRNTPFAKAFPGAIAAASVPDIEGVYENGMTFVFTNQVVVTDLDRRKAAENGVSPSVAAAMRVITHENYHKGLSLLSPRDQSRIMALLRTLFPAAELDALARRYKKYANWRTNPASEMALLDERLQKAVEDTKTIPADGPWKEFWELIKSIWRKITGQPKAEPKLEDLKDVVRLIRKSLKDAHKPRPDVTKDGGRVLMSFARNRGLISPEKVARHAELEAKYNAGTITPEETAEAQALVDEAAKKAGYSLPLWHGSDFPNFNKFELGRTGYRGMLLSTNEVKSNGVFLSGSREDASGYGKNVRHFYVSKKNVLNSPDEVFASSRMTDAQKAKSKKTWDDAEYILSPAIYSDNGNRYIDTDNGVSRTEIDPDGNWISKVFKDGKIDWSLLDNPEVVKRMKERGYDSVRVYEPNDSSGESWFVTDPSQIKSADPFTGVPLDQRFDVESPDIRYSIAPNYFTQAVNLNGRVETGTTHYDAWIKHVLRQLPAYQKDGLSERERFELADKWLVAHPEFLSGSVGKEGFMTPDGFMDRKQAFKKFIAMGGKPDIAPGEVRDWLDSSDLSGPMMSLGAPISYASESEQAESQGQQMARALSVSPRQLEAMIGVRKAYEAMPKTNSQSVALTELFAKTRELVPNLTQAEFNDAVQGLYEDNAALFDDANVPNSIIILPKGPMMSLASSENDAKNAEYLAAVQAGDMATAQRMVDEAAKAAGYDHKMKHGTSADKFSSFSFDLKAKERVHGGPSTRGTVWVSDNQRAAEMFAIMSAAKARGGDPMNIGLSINQYGFADNPEKSPLKDWPQYADKARVETLFIKGDFLEAEMNAKASGDAIALRVQDEIKEAKKQKKDGVFFRSLKDFYLHDAMALFKTASIKSADPVTRDASGNVIPLYGPNGRFQAESPDIRYSLGASPEQKSAIDKFRDAIVEAAKGMPDMKEYAGKLVSDKDREAIEADPHKALWFEGFMQASADLIKDLQGEGMSLEDIYDKLSSAEFLQQLGLFDPQSGQGQAAVVLVGNVMQRSLNASRKAKTKADKARLDALHRKVAAFYYGLGTRAGQNLLLFQLLQNDPRTRFVFLEDNAAKEMLGNAGRGLNVSFGGAYGDTQVNTAGNVETSATSATANLEQEAAELEEDDQDAIDLAAGEATLTGEDKTLWNQVKDWLRAIGAAMKHIKDLDDSPKFSLSAAQRDEISKMTKEEALAFIADTKKKVNKALKTMLGIEAEADTPAKKDTRKKREKMVNTAKKRAEKGKDTEITLTEFGKLVNQARRDIKGATGKAVKWREIFRQSGKSVEEVRKNMLSAIMGMDAFKDMDDAQKRKLADMFSEIWGNERAKVLGNMQKTEENRVRRIGLNLGKNLEDSRNQIIEAANLGVFDNDELTRILGDKFGFKTKFTDEEKAKLSELAEKIQEEDNPARRNKFSYEFLSLLEKGTKIPIPELLANWWVGSVLTGGNTLVSIGASFLNGTGIGILGTHLSRALRHMVAGDMPKAIDAITSLFKAYARHFGTMGSAGRRAWQYLWTGKRELLEAAANDPFKNVKTLADIERHHAVADAIARDPNKIKAFMGRFMQFSARLLTALDAFNIIVTKAGVLSLALRQSNLAAKQIVDMERKADLKVYKENIVKTDPEFGGKYPTTSEKKAYLDSLAEAALYKDMQTLGAKMENADWMAAESAMTTDPTGFGGMVYQKIKTFDKDVTIKTRHMLAMAEDAYLDAKKNGVKGQPLLQAWGKMFAIRVLNLAAEQGLNFFGLRFARFAGNKFNQSLSFIPVLGALRILEQDNPKLAGSKEAFRDALFRNQTIGFALAGLGVMFIKSIMDEPDDEKRGWALNGGWNNLTPDQKKQKLSRGEKQYTLRIGDQVFNYQNWPIGQVLAAIGEMSDLIRYSPDKWQEKSDANKALSAIIAGMTSTLEIPALTQVAEIFANSMASKDPTEQTTNRLTRVMAGWAGGFMPRFLKDADYILTPEMRKYEGFWQKTAAHIPIYRNYEGKEYYDILGNQIKKNAIPGSRDFDKLATEPEYQMLGKLNSRGIWLTPANAEYRMVGKGRNRRRLTQEEADAYSLETGKLYKQMILRYGNRALNMPLERAKDFISAKADDARDLALLRVTRK